jgi:hypothetical protein
MPTIKPRITVILPPDEAAILETLAKLQGVSKSSILAEVWGMASPVMARVCKLLTEAKDAQESVKEGIRAASDEAIRQMLPIHDQSMLNFDLFEEAIRQTIAGARAVDGETGARAAGAPHAHPPSSNTGVRFTTGRGSASKNGGGKS